MSAYICTGCGVQYPEGDQPPPRCLICEDERQYVSWEGQRWTTLAEMAASGYRNEVREVEAGLINIDTKPSFGIGQRALLVQTEAGNLLWDCVAYLDDATEEALHQRGGVQAIALSHPHFYGIFEEWSKHFGGVPVYIHAADRGWVTRPGPTIIFWEGETVQPLPGLTLVHLGGHFDGSAVLYWPAGADGRGALLSSDTVHVTSDRRFVSFMYSYPNFIPLSAAVVARIAATLRPYRFDRVYGATTGRVVQEDGAQAVQRSAERYIRYLQRS